MWLRQVTPPATTPVSLAEAKAHLRVLNTAEDALIGGLIEAATGHVDGRAGVLGRALITQTWELRLDAFPRSCRKIELPMPPLQSVASVKYLDTAGVEQTLVAGSDYVVERYSVGGEIRAAYLQPWPATRPEPNAVRIVFTAGYGDAATDVPGPIKAALKMLIGHWHAHRAAVGDDTLAALPIAVDALLQPYRVCPI